MDNLEAVATVPVAKSKAVRQSGKNKGKLVKGCRYKGKRVLCRPEVAARLGASKPKKKSSRKRGAPIARPKTEEAAHRKQLFLSLLDARKTFKNSTTCPQKKLNARVVIETLRELMQQPKSASAKLSVAARNERYGKELNRVYQETMSFCASQGAATKWDDSKGFAGARGRRRSRR